MGPVGPMATQYTKVNVPRRLFRQVEKHADELGFRTPTEAICYWIRAKVDELDGTRQATVTKAR